MWENKSIKNSISGIKNKRVGLLWVTYPGLIYTIFQNEQFGEVRIAMNESNEPLFCLADVCNVIGIANARNVKTRLEDDDVRQMDTLTEGGKQQVTFITESGLYDVILDSRKPEAKKFRKWVTSEVLPSIRKHGEGH